MDTASAGTGAARDATPRTREIILKRSDERMRRDAQRALRRQAAEMGYDGLIRLTEATPGSTENRPRYDIRLDDETGVSGWRSTRTVGTADRSADTADILKTGLEMVDLALLARRREAAVVAAGFTMRQPPAWAFITHPIIRALVPHMGLDPATFLPTRYREWTSGTRFKADVSGMRLKYLNVSVPHGGEWLTVDAGNRMARVEMPGRFPDAVVDCIPGKPLASIIGLSGMEAGTRAGDSRIRDAFQGAEGLVFTVSCELEPMADAPDGVDVSFLRDWTERHAAQAA